MTLINGASARESSPVVQVLDRYELYLLYLLRLDGENDVHRDLYFMLKANIESHKDAMMQDRNVLLSSLRHDDSVQPPFCSAQVAEGALTRAVQTIYENAPADHRAFYDTWQDAAGLDTFTTWIIRSILVHTFCVCSREENILQRTILD